MGIITPHIQGKVDLVAGENAVIEVHKSYNGGAKLVFKDGNHPNGYALEVSPKIAVAIGLTLMETVGIPFPPGFAENMKAALQR